MSPRKFENSRVSTSRERWPVLLRESFARVARRRKPLCKSLRLSPFPPAHGKERTSVGRAFPRWAALSAAMALSPTKQTLKSRRPSCKRLRNCATYFLVAPRSRRILFCRFTIIGSTARRQFPWLPAQRVPAQAPIPIIIHPDLESHVPALTPATVIDRTLRKRG